MQPRLKTSKKWSPLPQELIKQIQSVFSQSFQEHIKGGKIEAGGRIYPEEILIKVGYKAGGGLRQKNWEISLPYKKDKDNVLKLLHLAVDAVGALFEQLFNSDDDVDFPRIWEEIDFEERKIWIQYTTINNELETKANELLGIKETDDEVAQGEWEEELSPDVIKATLGIDDEEFEALAPDEDELDEMREDTDDDMETVKRPGKPGGKKPSTH